MQPVAFLSEVFLSPYRPSMQMAAELRPRSRVKDWVRRYGFAELAGILTALAAAWIADALGAPTVIVAYVATAGENAGFYAVIITRQVAADRRIAIAAGESYHTGGVGRTMRDLLLEFGPAEMLDSFLFRPLAMGLGVRFIGRDVGVIAGKLVADVTFYLPVIVTYELRRQLRRRLHP